MIHVSLWYPWYPFDNPVELRFLRPIRNLISVMYGTLNILFFPNRLRFLRPEKFFGFIAHSVEYFQGVYVDGMESA